MTDLRTQMTEADLRYSALGRLLKASGVEPHRTEKIVADMIAEDRQAKHREFAHLKASLEDTIRYNFQYFRSGDAQVRMQQAAYNRKYRRLMITTAVFSAISFILSLAAFCAALSPTNDLRCQSGSFDDMASEQDPRL